MAEVLKHGQTTPAEFVPFIQYDLADDEILTRRWAVILAPLMKTGLQHCNTGTLERNDAMMPLLVPGKVLSVLRY